MRRRVRSSEPNFSRRGRDEENVPEGIRGAVEVGSISAMQQRGRASLHYRKTVGSARTRVVGLRKTGGFGQSQGRPHHVCMSPEGAFLTLSFIIVTFALQRVSVLSIDRKNRDDYELL